MNEAILKVALPGHYERSNVIYKLNRCAFCEIASPR